MKIAITGGAGFLGSHLTDALVAAGHEVRILDCLAPPVHQGPWPAYLEHREAVELVRGDVRDPELVYATLRGMDRVVHLAAHQDYLPDYSKFADVNVRGAALLYETIERYRLPIQKVALASSQAVYGEGPHRCLEPTCPGAEQNRHVRTPAELAARQWGYVCQCCGHRNTEPYATLDGLPAEPLSPYGLSKLHAEQTALFLGNRLELPTAALRYSIMQGPRQSFRNAYSGILRSFTLRWLSGQAPVAYEDGEQLRDYLHIEDAVRATLLALFDDRAQGVYNVPGKQVLSVRDYAHSLRCTLFHALKDRRGAPALPALEIPGLYRVGDTRHIFSDGGRLGALGWAPQHSVARIQADYVDWVLSLPGYEDHFAGALAQMQAAGVVKTAESADD